MTAEYSAHPALAPAQLQRAEATQSHHQSHRRHHPGATSGKSGGGGGGLSGGGGGGGHQPTPPAASIASKFATATAALATLTTDAPTLPDRTTTAAAATALQAADEDDDGVCCAEDDGDGDDGVANASNVASVDEPDHVHHRFSRTLSSSRLPHTSCHPPTSSSSSKTSTGASFHCSRQQPHLCHQPPATAPPCIGDCDEDDDDEVEDDDGDGASGLSSAGSSPSVSTTSSPLSTPTRHVVPPCCQKPTGAAGAASAAAAASSSSTTTSATSTTAGQQQQQQQQHHPHTHPHLHHQQHQYQHQQHQHHHHHHHHNVAGCKKLQKFDPRLGPSPYRQLLPIALCILSFATVFSILIVYMDTTEIRHQQFRLNMSRDYELNGVAQDDPTLIAFLREIHMQKYPMHFLKNRDAPEHQHQQQQQHHQYPRLNFSGHHELTPEMAHYVADLVGRKQNGAVIQSLPGAVGQMLTAPWLAETLNWAGVIVEPEPRRYFALRKQNAHHPKMQVVHACVSPNEHPKEVTIHNEDAEVRINSLLDEETSWFNSRVKCFPLYTIMLACNRVEYDLLSLGVHGHELEILQTLPFDKIQIEVISIHFPEDHDNVRVYIQSVTKFLKGKSYKLQRNFGRNYFYQKINSSNRTRKKDILLMKQP